MRKDISVSVYKHLKDVDCGYHKINLNIKKAFDTGSGLKEGFIKIFRRTPKAVIFER